jgi:hypothetical protein
MKISLLFFIVAASFLSACAPLKSNIQTGNATGKIEQNSWDYYNGTPISYTSNQRLVTTNDLIVANEITDNFQIVINAQKDINKAILVMNGKTIVLGRFSDGEGLDRLYEKSKKHWGDRAMLNNPQFSDWYVSDDLNYYLVLLRSKNIILTFYFNEGNAQSIKYYPSRYLACKKIAMVKAEKDKSVVAALLKTALVAGIQSYTNYATGTYTSAYGDFGYVSIRDYSWAGERAGEALGTLFSGQYSEEKITEAWNSLNCW